MFYSEFQTHRKSYNPFDNNNNKRRDNGNRKRKSLNPYYRNDLQNDPMDDLFQSEFINRK